jgi:crotonobetainyl-CoA:carnitine CoA-transferase CaiB-like acyl-CoA transferase
VGDKQETRQLLPLEGLVVLELAHTVMGPTAGLLFADLGAEVIRVEPAPEGDRTRRLRGFASGFFSYFNRNKKSLCIDLKSDEGFEIARKLILKADVLIENFAPGTMERLGLGWERLHALNARLILCSLKGFLPGPYENRPALDEIVQYMTGLAYMTGPRGMPLRAGSSVVDIMGGVMGVVGVLAALRQRDRDGLGRKVTSSLYESSAFFVAQHMAGEAVTGAPAPPMPSRDSAWAIYETFSATDGPLFIGITSNNHWKAFCTQFGREDLLAVPEYRENETRVMYRDALRPIVAEVVARHSIAELSEVFDRINIPFSPVRRPGDLFDDPQLNANGRMLDTRMPDGKMVKLPSLPFEIDGKAPALRLQPPLMGQDTDDILASLGYTVEQVAALRAQGKVK